MPTKSTRTRKKTPPILKSIDPTSGEIIREFPANSPADVADVVDQARKVAPEWAGLPPQARARMLREVRARVYELLDDLVAVISAENGKPLVEALAHDVAPTVMNLLYHERNAARVLKPERIGMLSPPVLPKLLSGFRSRIEYRPFGVVGCITPWNYPLNLAFAAIAPALAAGNVVVVKPSEVTPGVGEMIKSLLEPLPPGVATVIQGGGDVGAALVDAPCDKICFIGSPATGRKIAEAAAKHLTPVVMELGGQDPAIVCDDADLDVASSGVLWGAFYNAGQTCVSMERAYVADSIADEFQERLLAKLELLRQDRMGDVGPLTFARQLDIVTRHVDDAIAKGARVLGGGPETGRSNENGSLWYSPTVVEGVTDEMDLMKEETFGPVLPIIRFRDDDDAVRRANEDGISLTASVWTRDTARAERILAKLRVGSATINEAHITEGMPWTPWGGVGGSGYGRVSGSWGLREFTYPVHIARKSMPGMKSLWWYPYDDATHDAWRGVVSLVAAPTVKEKIAGARTLGRSAMSAIRSKL